MPDNSRALSRSITRASSRQTYYTILHLVDGDLIDDGFRAYAYFRWVDDVIDQALTTRRARLDFVASQKDLIRRGFAGEAVAGVGPEETIVVDLIAGRKAEHASLRSYLANMMAVMEFDAGRRGRLIGADELAGYTGWLARGVMDGLDYFIDHPYPYPASPARHLAVAAAHVVHMLRDTVEDSQAGYFNIPRETLEAGRISPDEVDSPVYRDWVRERVDLARGWFDAGKRYIGTLSSFRSRLAGYCYCARFELVLHRIQRDRFILQSEYAALPGLALIQGIPGWRDWPALAHPLSMSSQTRAELGHPHLPQPHSLHAHVHGRIRQA
jgi:phytoene/squalene synthetase